MAHEQYLSLMRTVRSRFDIIADLKERRLHPFLKAESAAFHGRKIVEAIAFGCLTAIDNGFRTVPADARGQWNAETIFRRLKPKGLAVLPRPSIYRPASPDESMNGQVHMAIQSMPERQLSLDELLDIYQELHAWLHEANPYVHSSQDTFLEQRSSRLWADIEKLRLFMESHFMAAGDAGFICTLWDSKDDLTRVLELKEVTV